MNRYGRWIDAAFAQQRIMEWYKTRLGVRYLVSFFEDMNRKHKPEARRDVRMLAGIQGQTILEAEPIYVSDEMTELIDVARQTLEPEPVLASDPFVSCGFALFARPLTINDQPVTENSPMASPSGLVPIRAISWMPVHSEDMSLGTFWISFYVHIDDEIELHPNDHRWTGDHAHEAEYVRRFCPLQLVHQWQWQWGAYGWREEDNLDVSDGESPGENAARAKQQTALVQTFWRLGQQIVPTKEPAPRQVRRERERREFKHRSDVNVMVLRKAAGHPREDHSGRHIGVRHPVRGHWTKRHTREGTRQVWIWPYIRGDESLPFRVPKRAWDFRR